MNSSLDEVVKSLAKNLSTDQEVKKALIELESLDIPKVLLLKYNIELLARRYMMTEGLKEEARKLMGKVRRIVKEDVRKSPENSSSDEGVGEKRLKPNGYSNEDMTASKRTAPMKLKLKKKSLENVKLEDMTVAELQLYLEENPSMADELEVHFKKFVQQDFPLAARYQKPDRFTWKHLYEMYTELKKEAEETKRKEEKKAEEAEKFRKMMEKKASSEKKKMLLDQKKAEQVSNTLSYMEECRQLRIQEARLAKETGKWPVHDQKGKRKM